MPLEEGVLIACKDGVVEMTATVTRPETDSPEELARAISDRIFDHQYQAMTDPVILNPINLGLSTCILSRDPFSEPLKNMLAGLAFSPVDTEATGGSEERSLFSRLQKPRRAKLEKWRTQYLRASDISERLSELEEAIAEEMPRGPYPDVLERGAEVLAAAARTYLKLLLAPTLECVGQLERALLQERASKKGRMVLHSATVRALTCFVAQTLIAAAPRSSWSEAPEDSAPLHVEAPSGGIVRSDPEFRVVNFVVKGSKEMLSTYIEGILRQSLTAGAQT